MFRYHILLVLCFLYHGIYSEENPIRLVNGPTKYEGRLEVYHDDQWGSMCDDMVRYEEAEVVCRQLGFSNFVQVKKMSFFGQGSGPIMLDNVRCYGNESAITECAHNGWYVHNCFHEEDVGFVCEWADGTVRIHHDTGKRELAGRVQIYSNGTWSSVCGNQWDIVDAHVACKEAGFATAIQLISTAKFNNTCRSYPVVLSDVNCNGDEASILECPHSGFENVSCDPNDEAGAVCIEDIDDFDVRLVDDNIHDDHYDRGELQIYHSGSWGVMCADEWTMEDAQVVCRQLGYETADTISEIHTAMTSLPVYRTTVSCSGSEHNIMECVNDLNQSSSCEDGHFAFVTCRGSRVRLTGGTSSSEGLIEVFHLGEWGTICDPNMNIGVGDVVCRQLGLPGAKRVIVNDLNNKATDRRVMLSNVDCSEKDEYLSDCSHNGWFIHSCEERHDVSVICDRGPVYRTRLVDDRKLGSGASINFEGRIEMFRDGAWGTVCDTNWNIDNALVVCKELGFHKAVAALRGSYFGGGSGPILMDNVTCYNENSLSHCSHTGWYEVGDCTHADDAGVICDPGHDVPIRLRNDNEDKYIGVVETFYDGVWQTVCPDQNVGSAEGNVVCRQIFNNEDHVEVYLKHSPYDEDSHFLLTSCGGWEFELVTCEHRGWSICLEEYSLGVSCTPQDTHFKEGDVRLVDGPRAWEGRVEIYHNNVWGSVCDSMWDLSDAKVVCYQLGFPATFQATTGSVFGFGSGIIHMDYVNCQGSEHRLDECLFQGWDAYTCDVTREAGIVCGFEEGALRLVDGKNKYEGRIEIYHEDVWGTICDAMWGVSDADVACRQLGYTSALSVYHGAYFGEGSGPVLLDYVSCYGYESRLNECPRGNWYDTDCDHTRDAGVKCVNPNKEDKSGITFNISILTGLVICFLCAIVACFRPMVALISKHRHNNGNSRGSTREIHYPGNFSDFEFARGDDAPPTYQDAAADLPPAYENLYCDLQTSDANGDEAIVIQNPAAQNEANAHGGENAGTPQMQNADHLNDDNVYIAIVQNNNLSPPAYTTGTNNSVAKENSITDTTNPLVNVHDEIQSIQNQSEPARGNDVDNREECAIEGLAYSSGQDRCNVSEEASNNLTDCLNHLNERKDATTLSFSPEGNQRLQDIGTDIECDV